MSILVPQSLSGLVAGRPPEPDVSGDDWLVHLPGLVEEALAEWNLTLDGQPMHGACALVLPVRPPDGSAAVLKVTWPHTDAEHEHLALQRWAGHGAARLLAANPRRWAMLIERLDGARDLNAVPIDEACQVIGGLLRALDHPALPQLSRLSDECARLVERLDSASAAVPRRFVDQSRMMIPDLVADAAIDSRMVHTDMHYGNVLAARRQPWLAIDPKPLNADPAFAVTPALWNRWEEAVGSGDLRGHLRRRLSIICEWSGVDEDRARAWSIVREMQMALWAVEDEHDAGLTKAIAIIKAMQPN